MPLELGKQFNRHYSLRIPFINGFYNIGIFYHKQSTFLLFKAEEDSEFDSYSNKSYGIKVNMFKNLQTSKFCETFLDLHNYRGENLDISNQFKQIKDDYYNDIIFTFNEVLTLSKHEYDDKVYYSNVLLYGFTLAGYTNEFLFIIAERQHISSRLKKKIVRTTALQLSTSQSLKIINEHHDEYKKSMLHNIQIPAIDSTKIINLDDINDEISNHKE